MIKILALLCLSFVSAKEESPPDVIEPVHTRPAKELPALTPEDFGPEFSLENAVEIDEEVFFGNQPDANGERSRRRRRRRQTRRTCYEFRRPVYTDIYCEAVCVAYKFPYRSHVGLRCVCC